MLSTPNSFTGEMATDTYELLAFFCANHIFDTSVHIFSQYSAATDIERHYKYYKDIDYDDLLSKLNEYKDILTPENYVYIQALVVNIIVELYTTTGYTFDDCLIINRTERMRLIQIALSCKNSHDVLNLISYVILQLEQWQYVLQYTNDAYEWLKLGLDIDDNTNDHSGRITAISKSCVPNIRVVIEYENQLAYVYNGINKNITCSFQ